MNTLLLVEDEPDLLASMATALELEGYRVLRAADGSAGLARARKHRPDLVVCDIQMPGMDGVQLLAAMRRDPQLGPTPFIFLTARGEREDLRRGMLSGADDYLIKPVPLTELLEAIRSRLARFATSSGHAPNFSNARPLLALGLSPKQAETLLWVAQGKTNRETAEILGISEGTVKKHLEHIFAKLGVETRGAASLLAIERLGR